MAAKASFFSNLTLTTDFNIHLAYSDSIAFTGGDLVGGWIGWLVIPLLKNNKKKKMKFANIIAEMKGYTLGNYMYLSFLLCASASICGVSNSLGSNSRIKTLIIGACPVNSTTRRYMYHSPPLEKS